MGKFRKNRSSTYIQKVSGQIDVTDGKYSQVVTVQPHSQGLVIG